MSKKKKIVAYIENSKFSFSYMLSNEILRFPSEIDITTGGY